MTEQKIICPGNSTRYWIIVGTDDNGTPFVALPDFGTAATMAYGNYTSVDYVMEKLKLSKGDAVPVAKILTEWNAK